MSHPKPMSKRGSRSTTSTIEVTGEWVGGRFQMPAFVTAEAPYRPDIVLWADVTEGVIVGSEIVEPTAPPEAMVDCLSASIKEPMAGAPHQPKTIRIVDPALASLVRSRLGESTEVQIEPTPEIDEILAHMTEEMGSGGQERSYLEAGRVTPETVAQFFSAAAKLYRQAPWEPKAPLAVIRRLARELGMRHRLHGWLREFPVRQIAEFSHDST
jgi:hypothetical protein